MYAQEGAWSWEGNAGDAQGEQDGRSGGGWGGLQEVVWQDRAGGGRREHEE